MADTGSTERGAHDERRGYRGEGGNGQGQAPSLAGERGPLEMECEWCGAGGGCGCVPDASEPGLSESEPEAVLRTGGGFEGGTVTEFRGALFPPGPADRAGWAELLAHSPHLAPALAGRLNANFVDALMAWPVGWTDIDGLWEDYAEFKARSRKALRVLLRDAPSETIREAVGIHERLPAPDLLQSALHGDGEAEGNSNSAGIPLQGEETSERCLRTLRDELPSDNSPHRPRLVKQRPREFTNPMQFVSYVTASCRRGDIQEARRSAMHAVRAGYFRTACMSHLSDEDQAGAVIECCIGVSMKGKRTDRLRAGGNGVVAIQVAAALRLLMRRAANR